MAATNESGLEPARHDFPEVGAQEQKGHSASHDYPEVVTQQHYHQYPTPSQSYDSPQVPPNQDYPIPPFMYGGQTTASPYSPPTQAEKTQGAVAAVSPLPTPSSKPPSVDKRNRTVFGCTTAVFILSCIIALLLTAVIGLLAATAIEAKRANDNASRLAAFESSLSTRPSSTRSSTDGSSTDGSSTDGSSGSESSETKPSVTGAPPVTVTTTVTGTPSATSSSLVDDGCSTDPDKINKSTYTSYPVVGEKTFTRYCNKDSKGTTVLVLFTASFSSCMDACGAYSSMMPKTFGTTGTNATCTSVSFIPEWVSKEAARKTNSRGSCFLKAGPQNESHLSTPGKVTVHVAIVTS